MKWQSEALELLMYNVFVLHDQKFWGRDSDNDKIHE